MRLRSANINKTKTAETFPAQVKDTALGRSNQSCMDKINILRIIIEQRMKYTANLRSVFVVFFLKK